MTVRKKTTSGVRAAAAALLLLGPPAAASAADWPQWRGPGRDGVCRETGWRTAWPEGGPRQLWEKDVGRGFAAVAAVKGRLYTSGNAAHRDRLWCLDAATGECVWSYSYPQHSGQGGQWPGTQATPTVAAGRVYHYSRDARLFCLDANTGAFRWWRDLPSEYGVEEVIHDYASSPLVTDGVVIVTAKLPDATIVAFDAATGKEAWRANHPATEVGGIWSSPVVGTIDGRRCVVRLTGRSVVGVGPADGKTLWTYEFRAEEGFEPHRQSGVAATPVLWGDRVVFHHHIKGGETVSGCIEVREGRARLVWTNRRFADQWRGGTAWRGRIFGHSAWGGAGRLHCVDLATGETLWSARRFGEADAGGSFLLADGKLIHWHGGVVSVVAVSDEGPRLLASAKVCEGRGLFDVTPPVLSAGLLYLRATALPQLARPGHSTLYCLDLRAPAATGPSPAGR